MITGAAVVSAATPQASAEVSATTVGPFLRLHLSGTTGTVTLEQNNLTLATQTITSTRCEVVSDGPQLLTFTPSTGKVGIVSSGLGVRTKNNCNTDSGRIGVNQTLQVHLGPSLSETVHITKAELDIEGKFGAQLNVVLDDDDELFPTDPLSTSSDNGPDSGPGDNTRITIDPGNDPGPFRTIELSPTTGTVSLEGGGDYSPDPGPADTLLYLDSAFAEALSCGESLAAVEIGTGVAAFAEVRRYDNNTGDCQDIGATFENRSSGVLLDKSTVGLANGAFQDVSALVEIVWEPQVAAVPLPARQITLNPADEVPVWNDVEWCADVDWTDWPPAESDPYEPPPLIDLDTDPLPAIEHAEGVPWCLVSERVVMVPGGEDGDAMVQQIQVYHGSGDPMWK